MPFGMIVQSASKYRSSAIVVECETAIAASSMSSRAGSTCVPTVIAERLVEVRVKRADGGTVGLLDREHRQDRAERRVNVHDVVASIAQNRAHVASQSAARRLCAPASRWRRPAGCGRAGSRPGSELAPGRLDVMMST